MNSINPRRTLTGSTRFSFPRASIGRKRRRSCLPTSDRHRYGKFRQRHRHRRQGWTVRKRRHNTIYNTFAPRGGFSYAATKDNLTVVRGGFGMFHDDGLRMSRRCETIIPSIRAHRSSPPRCLIRRRSAAVVSDRAHEFRLPLEHPLLHEVVAGVQRQLPAELLLDVSYVGSRGVALVRNRDINQPIASAAVASGQLNPNAARPYPGFAGITTYETSGNSIYHSLQASGTRRFSRGFALQASYTFTARSITT